MPSVAPLARTLAATAEIAAVTVLDGVLRREDMAGRADERLERWSSRLLRIADIRLTIEGRAHLGQGETFVVMSNHQSHFDVPVIYAAIPGRLRMVGKTELFRIPVFGRAMRLTGFVEVDRRDRSQAVHALQGARDALASGTHIWIAPEGTRSETGRLAAFKKGGFHLALDAGARILPVSIDGTKDVLAAHGRVLQRGQPVRVVIGAPIDTRAFGPARMPDLIEAVRDAIGRELSG